MHSNRNDVECQSTKCAAKEALPDGPIRLSYQGTKVNSRGKEMPHGTRLYSIAASRYGDKFDGKTTTLCVRRATYWDSEKVTAP